MRLAVSNIAWDIAEDPEVAKLLQKFAIDAIDIAPSKYFPDLNHTTGGSIDYVKQWWADRGIEITGMQALLFNTNGLNIFGDSRCQYVMLEYLRQVFGIAKRLGATRLVFGSPRNRDRSGLCDTEAAEIAVRFFRRLGDIALENGVIVCLEPSPAYYGSNFMTTSREACQIVMEVDHAAVKMQFDSGALAMNNESPAALLRDSFQIIGHIHASEPNLVPLGDGGVDHAPIGRSIMRFLPEMLVSIEMLATKEEPHLQSIERSIVTADKFYRKAGFASR